MHIRKVVWLEKMSFKKAQSAIQPFISSLLCVLLYCSHIFLYRFFMLIVRRYIWQVKTKEWTYFEDLFLDQLITY